MFWTREGLAVTILEWQTKNVNQYLQLFCFWIPGLDYCWRLTNVSCRWRGSLPHSAGLGVTPLLYGMITATKLHETQFLCKVFCLGSILGQKYSPCTSPQSHILTTQSLLGHRHTVQTPQFGNSPDLGNTGLQACVFYRSSSLPWHKAPPSLAKEQEEKQL